MLVAALVFAFFQYVYLQQIVSVLREENRFLQKRPSAADTVFQRLEQEQTRNMVLRQVNSDQTRTIAYLRAENQRLKSASADTSKAPKER